MKIRILMLSLIGLMFFNSCSSDSNSSNQNTDPSSVLPKVIQRNNPEDGNSTFEFYYNQNKIDYIKTTQTTGISTGVLFAYFNYNGDLISSITHKDMSQNILFVENFSYQNNLLIQRTITDNYGNIDNNYYNYNPDGSGSYSYNNLNTINFTMTNGLLTSYNDFNQIYLSSFSPFKNIKGIDKIYSFLGYTNEDLFNIFYSTTYNIQNTYQNPTWTYSYSLNSDSYPISVLQNRQDGIGDSFNITYY